MVGRYPWIAKKARALHSESLYHSRALDLQFRRKKLLMKKPYIVLIAFCTLSLVALLLFSLREGGYLSSNDIPAEPPAPIENTGTVFTYNFDSEKPGDVPSKFHGVRTGRGAPGQWIVIADPSAPSQPNVVVQNLADPVDSRFVLFIADEGRFGDFDLRVKFKAMSGEVDRAAGLVFRLKDANNYYLARVNALEDNYRLYHVKGGKRHPFGGANLTVSAKEWHELRVECIGDRIICYYDGVKKIEATDETFRDAGKVGLWTKADSVTYFDDLRVVAK
jgi:hypothetical protein